MIYQASLWFHIIGITLLAGTTVTDFVLTRKFWTFYAKDRTEGILVRKMSDKLPLLIVAGIVLILLSGVGMMTILHSVLGLMLWFRIKMALVVVVILNGVVFGRRLATQLNRLLAAGPAQTPDEQSLNRVKRNLQLFHIAQLALFGIIFLLSAFKFN
ncbi:hypothetical protein [Paraflavitalea speifideaquila]|uniref:hypothetical protein n=1 Tax=Paraflavitalea speifideaquila TaxID=3076558 RepID=UPI0028E93449|nr:hypothetical protein [Paraflavitalea speifideiaquila]